MERYPTHPVWRKTEGGANGGRAGVSRPDFPGGAHAPPRGRHTQDPPGQEIGSMDQGVLRKLALTFHFRSGTHRRLLLHELFRVETCAAAT